MRKILRTEIVTGNQVEQRNHRSDQTLDMLVDSTKTALDALLTAMEFTPLPRKFYEPSAAIVAERLLGHWLIRRTPHGLCGGAIVETEAYLCKDDPACHGAVGETPRNRVMWGEPGFGYIYYIYGNYHCFNAVCHQKGVA